MVPESVGSQITFLACWLTQATFRAGPGSTDQTRRIGASNTHVRLRHDRWLGELTRARRQLAAEARARMMSHESARSAGRSPLVRVSSREQAGFGLRQRHVLGAVRVQRPSTRPACPSASRLRR
jgi:hypothetical protein